MNIRIEIREFKRRLIIAAQYGNFSRPSYQVTFTTQVASSAII
jgi:hypothetical protein